MSDYRYYEFTAVESPLDEAAMARLRALSSRALCSRFGSPSRRMARDVLVMRSRESKSLVDPVRGLA